MRPDKVLVPGTDARYDVRIRYRQDLEPARLYAREDGMYIIFDNPQKAIARGQFAVWYEGDELVGSGVIN